MSPRSSSRTASPALSASASISAKKAAVTLEAVCTVSKEELTALFVSCGLPSPAPGLTDTDLRIAFLRSYGIDPKMALAVFVNTTTARQLQQAAEKVLARQASLTEVEESLARSRADAARALSETQRNLEQQAARMEECCRELKSLQDKSQELHRQQSDAAVSPSVALTNGHPFTLRCTGLKEEAHETEEELLDKVNSNLGQLSSQVMAVGAERQGRPVGRKSRAVIIAFSNLRDRSAVLRTKAELSKTADLRCISIDVVLNADEQQQKNALWPVYMQAKQNRQRVTWRGCQLFIDGREYSGTCAPNASMSYEIRGGSNLPDFVGSSSQPSFPTPSHYQPLSCPTSMPFPQPHAQLQPHLPSHATYAQAPNPLYQHHQPQQHHQPPQQQQHRLSRCLPPYANAATPLAGRQ